YVVLFFFFSSRRRHTRSKRDWSSDVCSSDLWMEVCEEARTKFAKLINAKPYEVAIVTSLSHAMSAVVTSLTPNQDKNELIVAERSEERRVGKEWSCRGGWYDGMNRERYRR